MINNSLLLRTAGNHPLIQVRERSMLAAFLIGGKQEFVSAKQPRAWDRLFNSGKIKPRGASPLRGRSTRVVQDRGAVRMATNPDCAAPSTRRRPRRFRAR